MLKALRGEREPWGPECAHKMCVINWHLSHGLKNGQILIGGEEKVRH